MASKFSLDEAFPVIARLICDLNKSNGDWITHDELVAALLGDGAGRVLCEHAHESDNGAKSVEWWAGNMVAWFSQRITEGKSEYAAQYERLPMKDGYAYKPVPM